MVKGGSMKKNLWTTFIISCVVWIGIDIWQLSNPPRKEYSFLKAEVMYGNLPPNTARVSLCFAEFVGYRANWNGKFYYITGITGRNPFHPEHIYFTGNENIKIYNKRLIPVFRAGSIEDKIIGGEK